jgi:MerR family copper efflux transcriptional regulator
MKQIAMLLALWEDRSRPSNEVKQLARQHIAELNARIAELTEMRGTLEHLARHCRGDSRPECPILEGLAASRHWQGVPRWRIEKGLDLPAMGMSILGSSKIT